MVATGLGVSASLRQEPYFQLMRMSNLARPHLNTMREILARSEPSAAALADVAVWLAENRSPDATLARIKPLNRLFERMEMGDIDPNTASYIYPMTWPSGPQRYLGVAALIGRPFVRKAHARVLRHAGAVLDVLASPRPFAAVPEPDVPKRWALVDRLTDKFTAGLGWHVPMAENFISALGATETAVALRRFQVDHGAYSEKLGALVPEYLDRLPIDPFTSQLPRYSRQGRGFSLIGSCSAPQCLDVWAVEWTLPK